MGSHGGSRAGSSGGGGNSAKIATNGLAELRGTDKQISYANDIRNKYIENFQKQLDDIPDSFDKFSDDEIRKATKMREIEDMLDEPVHSAHQFGWQLSGIHSPYSDDLSIKVSEADDNFIGLRGELVALRVKGDISATRKAVGKEYNRLVKERKKQAVESMNEYLRNPNAGSSNFWIDNYKRILY